MVPVLWKLTGTPESFVIVQTLFSILCWSALAFVVARAVPAGWWRVLAPIAIFALAITAPVRLWDHSVLSETLALSWLAALIAALFLVVRRPTWPRTTAVFVAALGFGATRDTDVFTPIVLAVVFAVYAIARRPGIHWSGVRWRSLAVAGALLAGAVVPLALVVASGRSDLNVRNNYYVRVFPYADRVSWFAGHGMPEPTKIADMAAAQQPPAPGQVAVVAPDMNDPAYAPLYRWIRGHGARAYVEWLAVHPGYVFRAPFERPMETFNNDDAELGFYAGDETSTKVLDDAVAGPWWYAAGAAAVALMIAVLGGALPRREWLLTAAVTLVGAASVLAAWHGDGQEVTRHTVEGDVQVRLGLIIAFLIALPRWWRGYVRGKTDSPGYG